MIIGELFKEQRGQVQEFSPRSQEAMFKINTLSGLTLCE
jgi:hypothetical protein